MNFGNSIKTCLKDKYANFSGRASRSEFWFFILFLVISYAICFGLILLSYKLFWIFALFIIAIIIPTFAVTARRLHDINKTGWMQLIAWPFGILEGIFESSGQESLEILFLVIGLGLYVYLFILYCTVGDNKNNKFGKNIYLKKKRRRKVKAIK